MLVFGMFGCVAVCQGGRGPVGYGMVWLGAARPGKAVMFRCGEAGSV